MLKKKTLKNLNGAGEMAQFVKRLPHKQENLSFIPRNHLKKLDLVVCAGNPSTWKVEEGRCLGLTGQPA